MNVNRPATISLLFLACLSSGLTIAQGDDKSPDISKLHGKWIYLTVTKTVDGEERETSMKNSSLTFTEDGQFSQYQFVKDRILGKKGTFRLNKGGSLIMEYDGGKLGPYKFNLSEDGKQLTLVSIEETFKLRFKEE